MKHYNKAMLFVLLAGGFTACGTNVEVGDNTDTPVSQNTDQEANTDEEKECPLGFTGEKCKECDTSYYGEKCKPCKCANGECNDGIDGDGSCECEKGWVGATCAIECLGGADNPCNGKGTCNDDGSCTCEDGVDGLDCSGCSGNTSNPPACDGCVLGYYGPDCTNKCPGFGEETGICSGHGSCENSPESDGKCECNEGFAGELCNECAEGYKGPSCSLKCPGVGTAAGICSGNGTCSETGVCQCDDGWQGDACETERNSCNFGYEEIFDYSGSAFVQVIGPTYCGGPVNKVCNGHGTCNTNTQICECDSGYSGLDCGTSKKSSSAKQISFDYSSSSIIENLLAEEALGGENKTGKYPWQVGYDDDATSPFGRAAVWASGTKRCFEVKKGDQIIAKDLSEEEAYDMYKNIAVLTTGHNFKEDVNYRNIVGIRGAYPGSFAFHGNLPNRYNDTIVLLWKDKNDRKHVLEFPANTDTGAKDFSASNTSGALLANRHYSYINGQHSIPTKDGKVYFDAMKSYDWFYTTLLDRNYNGFGDSKRNGAYPGLNSATNYSDDIFRVNTGINIHYGQITSGKTYGTTGIGSWSAGCQVIPGHGNWQSFIDNAWTTSGAKASYYLVDVRDIDKRAWNSVVSSNTCTNDTENGTHDCPFVINHQGTTAKTYKFHGDTSGDNVDSKFDRYYCIHYNYANDGTDNQLYEDSLATGTAIDTHATNFWEKGGEQVYVLTLNSTNESPGDTHWDVDIEVKSEGDIDVDVHLLFADDPLTCFARHDKKISIASDKCASIDEDNDGFADDIKCSRHSLHQGRYYIVVDTYTKEDGTGGKPGEYDLTITLK